MELNLVIYDLQKLDGRNGTVYSVCLSPDGNSLASGSRDKSIHLWDVKTGQQIQSSNNRYIAKFWENERSPFYKTTLLHFTVPTNITILSKTQTINDR